MALWAKVRRIWVVGAVALAVLLTVLALGGLRLPVPAPLAVHGLAIPIAMLAPIALSTALAYGLQGGDYAMESVATRNLAAMDAGYALAVTTSTALVLLFGSAVGVGLGAEAARNCLGYVGLLLIARPIGGLHAAGIVPAALAVLVAFFGADNSGDPRWWAWMFRDAGDVRSWLFASMIFSLGMAAYLPQVWRKGR